MKKIFLVLGLLFSSATMHSSYSVGTLDTTANGGTGYGNATPGSATGYTNYSIGGASVLINASAVQPDGKVVIAGNQTASTGGFLLRYNVNGTIDTTFNSGSYSAISLTGATAVIATGVAIQPNGKIVVVGTCTITAGALAGYFVAQYTAAGVLDTASFGGSAGFILQNLGAIMTGAGTSTDSVDTAKAVAIDSSGRILVAGTSAITQTAASSTCMFVTRYSSAGVLDTTAFNTSGAVGGTNAAGLVSKAGIGLVATSAAVALAGNAVAIDAAGKILVAGSTATSTNMLVARFLTTGTLDTTAFNSTAIGAAAGTCAFDAGGADVAYGVAVQSSNNFSRIVLVGVTGSSLVIAGVTDVGLVETTGFGTSSLGYFATNFGLTSAQGKAITIQADDKIVVSGSVVDPTGPTTKFLIARFVANGSALDTSSALGNISFNGSTGYTVTDIATPSLANTISRQQNGSFILSGMSHTPDTQAATARYLGDRFVQGAMDLTYSALNGTANSANQGFALYPTDTTSTNKPQVVAMYPLSGSSVAGRLYVLSAQTAGSTNSQLSLIGSSGAAIKTAVTIAQPTPTDVVADSENRALVVGTTAAATHGFIARYIPGSGAAMIADPAFPLVTETTNSSSFKRVAEQSNGRIIVIGQDATATQGLLIAYNENGGLATGSQTVCVPFGTGSVGAQTGFITLAGATFYDMLIDANNRIYVAYSNGTNLCLARYLADGSALDSTFGTTSSGIIDTGLAVATYANGACLSFDAAGTPNIVIAASGSAATGISFQRYAPSATAVAATTTISAATMLLTTPVLTKLQCDTNNRLVFTGYDAINFFVGRMGAAAFSVDTTFAPYSSYPGIMKTMYSTNNPTRVSNSVAISSFNTGTSSNNGAILFGGYENIDGSNTVALVGQAVAWSTGTVYTQVPRFPGSLVDGTINTSFGTNGALNLNAGSSVPLGQAKALVVLSNGKQLIADSNGTSTNLTQLTSASALDTSFAGSTGYINLPLMTQAISIMVDTTGANYYVLGTNGTNAIVYKVTSAGALATFGTSNALVLSPLTSAFQIAQQASGRILVSGFNTTATSGVVVAFTPAGVVDTSFNPQTTSGTAGANTIPGYWYTNVAQPIVGLAVGTQTAVKDRIYIAYTDANSATANAVVRQLLENGTAYAPTSGTGAFTPIITGFAGTVNGNTQLRMRLDVNGKIILAAATSATPSSLSAARYTSVGAVDVAAAVIVPALANQTIQNLLTLSDGTTLILGAVPNSTPASASVTVARLTSAAVIDSATFNPQGTPGYITTAMPSGTAAMGNFYAIDVVGTGGILIAGDNGAAAASANPYLAAIVQNAIVTKVSQSATSLGAVGAPDTTFNPAGTTPAFLNLASADFSATVGSRFAAGTTVKVLHQNSNGTYYVAGDDGVNSYLSLMSDDDVQNGSFGTSGLLTISSQYNVSSVLVAQSGALLVAGSSAGTTAAGWLRSYNASTGVATPGFVAPAGAGNVLDAHYAVAQQSNGRILVAGHIGGTGKIIAYNSVTGVVDTTFGVNGIYDAADFGKINSMIVDPNNDQIYYVANGMADPDNAYAVAVDAGGSDRIWYTLLSANSSNYTNNYITLNQTLDIVAVTATTTGTLQIVLNTFARSTGAAGTPLNLPFGATTVATPVVTSIAIDTNVGEGKVIITGYDDLGTDVPFIIRVLGNLSSIDTSFNSPNGYTKYNTLSAGTTTNWYSSMINANGKITVGGYSSTTSPYLFRVYGDAFIGQFSPRLTPLTAGTPGTVNPGFGTSGYLSLIGTAGTTAVPRAVTPAIVPGGAQYVAFDDGTLARYTNGNILDTTYGTGGLATSVSPLGVYSMSLNGNGSQLLAGTSGTYGWVAQFTTAGVADPSFAGGFAASFGTDTVGTVAVQQSISRIVVAGRLASGNGALFGFTNAGVADATFAVGASATGVLDIGVATTIYALVADQYDRLIIAYKNGSNIDIRRYTSSGELDASFGSSGTLAAVIAGADDVAQVKVALNANGNIVVAAHASGGNQIIVKAYDNVNGSSTPVVTAFAATGFIAPVLTGLVTTADGRVLLSGNQSGNNPMFVFRVYNNSGAYAVDPLFAPSTSNVLLLSNISTGTISGRSLTSIMMYGDGEITMVGTETRSTGGVANNPFMTRAYNNPYTTQQPLDLNSKPVGTVSLPFGVTTAVANGITFFATTGVSAVSNQVARAAVMQSNNADNIVVAFDGQPTDATASRQIFVNMFDVDGLLKTTFKPSTSTNFGPGQALVLSMFDNQYVTDMKTFATVDGVSKAILAGYAMNTTPSLTSSLLIQYTLDNTTPALDSTFGGLNGNSLGVAFGDVAQLFTVGTQSNGRVIATGLDYSGNNVIVGYTANGKLDSTFGQGGVFVVAAGAGIYASAIDPQDRIVVAYQTDSTLYVARILPNGAGLDTVANGGVAFGTGGTGIITTTITTASANSNLRVAVDGAGNIAVAAVLTGGVTIGVARYTTLGVLDGTVNTLSSVSLGTLTSFTIAKMLIDANNAVVLIGYDNAVNDVVEVIRLAYAGGTYGLDPLFNAVDAVMNPTGTPGYIRYAVAGGTVQTTAGGFIHPTGTIIVGGSQLP